MGLVAAPSRAYLPGRTGTTLLRAALLEGDAARRAWRAARSEYLKPVRERAPHVRWLTPLLADNLDRQGVSDALLDELRPELARTEAANRKLFEHVALVAVSLDRAGIPTMLLKGAALVVGNARAAAVRPMSDVDLLVPPTDARRAWQLALDGAWTPRHLVTDAFLKVKHAAHLADADRCQLDLHWYVFEDSCTPETDEGLWRRSEPVPADGAVGGDLSPAAWGSVRRPSATDALLHACVHGARWTRTPGIRWVTDAWQIMATRKVDWTLLVDEAQRRGYTVRLRSTLRYMRRALYAPVPAEVPRQLAAARPGIVERLEHAALAHEQRRLGALPSYVFAFHRAHRSEMPFAVRDFPAYLAAAWEVATPADLVRAATARAGARLRGHAAGR